MHTFPDLRIHYTTAVTPFLPVSKPTIVYTAAVYKIHYTVVYICTQQYCLLYLTVPSSKKLQFYF